MALGRSNSLFAGLLRAGQRAAVIMSLIRSAKLNDQDPVTAKTLSTAYLRMPTVDSRNCCLTAGSCHSTH